MTRGRPDRSAPDRPIVAVFDIDGVVADVRHRLPLLESRPKDWDGFFTMAQDDPPLARGVAMARSSARDHPIVWLTGRPERLRHATVAWLARHDLPGGTLLMRAAGDFRPARLMKRDALRRLDADVAYVVDDDAEVLAMARAEGFEIRLADWMAGGEPLRAAQESGNERGPR